MRKFIHMQRKASFALESDALAQRERPFPANQVWIKKKEENERRR